MFMFRKLKVYIYFLVSTKYQALDPEKETSVKIKLQYREYVCVFLYHEIVSSILINTMTSQSYSSNIMITLLFSYNPKKN